MNIGICTALKRYCIGDSLNYNCYSIENAFQKKRIGKKVLEEVHAFFNKELQNLNDEY